MNISVNRISDVPSDGIQYQDDDLVSEIGISVIEMWELYGSLLWENGTHKDSCFAFAYQIHEIMLRDNIFCYDNNLIDRLVLNFRNTGNKNSTINRKLSCLSKLLRKHVQNGGMNRMPDIPKLREGNGRTRYLTYDEEAEIRSALAQIDPDYERLALFLVDTGARIGEALALVWADIVNEHATFWETKSNSPRTVPLTDSVMEMLSELPRKRRKGPFAQIQYYKFRQAWIAAKEAAGLKDDTQVVPHILRHTCASRLAQSGVDIKRIQEFLGHKSLAMTMRYAHLSPMHLDVCSTALDSFRIVNSGEPGAKSSTNIPNRIS